MAGRSILISLVLVGYILLSIIYYSIIEIMSSYLFSHFGSIPNETCMWIILNKYHYITGNKVLTTVDFLEISLEWMWGM